MDEYLKIAKKGMEEGKTEPEIRQEIRQKIRKELGKKPLRNRLAPYREEPMENKLEILQNKSRCDNCMYMRKTFSPNLSGYTVFYCAVFSEKIFQERIKDTPVWASRHNLRKCFYEKEQANCENMNHEGDCKEYRRASFIRIFMRRAFWRY